jgi:hypothetical protein
VKLPRRPDDERGAVLVMTALFIIAALTMTALVLDVGNARAKAISAQTAADSAALAGGKALASSQPRAACQDAVGYLRTNVERLSSLSTAVCNSFPVSSCTGSGFGPTTVQSTPPGATVRFTYPVPDSAISDSRVAGPWANDGTPCDRMRVELTLENPTTFARVVGIDDLPVTRSATVKAGRATVQHIPALWLLDPTGCTALNVGGGSQLTVGTTGVGGVPGIVAIDSNGTTCSSNQATVTAGGTGTFLHAVPTTGEPKGRILLHALPAGATTCDGNTACVQADASSGRLSPFPIRNTNRATRAPVDWRFNCKTSYPDYPASISPKIPIQGCPSGDPPYIDNLKSAIGATGAPAGFQAWSPGRPCSGMGHVTVSGNWWINCPSNPGFSIGNGHSVTFNGGNVLIDGTVSTSGSGTLTINNANPTAALPSTCTPPSISTFTATCLGASSSQGAWVYHRTGDLDFSGPWVNIRKTAVIQNNGVLKIRGTIPTWTAPKEGPFAGLAYWAETPGSYTMAGGAGMELSGVFFTPEANEFSLTGGGSWGQQAAQFISYRLKVSGGGIGTLAPDDTLIGIASTRGELIR